MSLQLINQYRSKVERYIQYGGSRNEQSLRNAFYQLLEGYARTQSLELIAELEYRVGGVAVYPDGTLKDALRQDRGYWESKDQYDDLYEEVDKKFQKGYPNTNILFDDTRQVLLYQNGQEVGLAVVEDAETLNALLSQFVSYEPPSVKTFRDAIEKFKLDIPDLLGELRKVIEEQASTNSDFTAQRNRLLDLTQKAINPHLGLEDVREMVIQHILTEGIFTSVFNDSHFHRENNIARELYKVTETFFTGALRKNALLKIEPYYNVIKAAAANIANHHEKQKFLKVVYENFYKAYNPAATDRLGIVYTPNEIVRFMIEAADHLTHKHFGKFLGDEGVNILDPATGTGTFITEIIEYLPKHQLKHKYAHELFCNEVALLPYYTANLNIEYTYQQKMGHYAEFENIAFVDTLENLNYVGSEGQFSMFELTAENLERIKRQNENKISVIIGNPPYNANQLNENENNKNRSYPFIDERIKNTYVKESTAQKTKVYDMYSRFIRWASDRVGENGVIAFVVNRSFIDSHTFDGFRKVVAEEFGDIYIVDLGGDVRANPKLSGTTHNVFGIQTGVTIVYFVKREKRAGKANIYYTRRPEMETAREKLQWINVADFEQLPFKHIVPNKRHIWINQAENEWDDLLPVATSETKAAEKQSEINAVYKFYSLGVSTNRDEWVYDFSKDVLKEKVQFFIKFYEADRKRWLKEGRDKKTRQEIPIGDFVNRTIKWTSNLQNHLARGTRLQFNSKKIVQTMYRPFVTQWLYSEDTMSDRLTSNHFEMFGSNLQQNNTVITFSGSGASKSFSTFVTDKLFSLDLLEKTQCLPLYRYDDEGNRLDNITGWGLKKFREHYGGDFAEELELPNLKVVQKHYAALEAKIEEVAERLRLEDGNAEKIRLEHQLSTLKAQLLNVKENAAIFCYTYGVLHNPAYRKKYELNLKREFPHIPFYEDFAQWAAWGERLMSLHLDYETVAPYPLKRNDAKSVKNPKAKLKADREAGLIVLDSETGLSGVPSEVWDYKLGNRSALEWVLDRYKEKKPRDPTIREKFNAYRFVDYKEEVIDLLKRVCTVSVKTVKIIREMENLEKIGVEKITA